MEITKAVTELNLLATPEGLEGAGSITLKVLKQGIRADESVELLCNDPDIMLVEQENDQWMVSLPNETKTYTFTETVTYQNGNEFLAGGPKFLLFKSQKFAGTISNFEFK